MLDRFTGDAGMARIVSRAFLDDIPRLISALKQALSAGNAPEAERLAHSIKGASAAVGGEALRAVAREMECSAHGGDVAAASGRLPELDRQFDLLRDALEQQ
jgi:HPt (histidine-containing phosphotransfer) domain-containing protein